MLLHIGHNIFVGNEEGLVFTNKKDWAIIHACQSYHYRLFGWNHGLNRPRKDAVHYLQYEEEGHISVNLVDGKKEELFEWFGTVGFNHLLDFIDRYLKQGKKIFIHCDRGESRSPTIGLLYLAKRAKSIPNTNFTAAAVSFKKIYPLYKPGEGISKYVSFNWKRLT